MNSTVDTSRAALPRYSTPAEFLAVTGAEPVHYAHPVIPFGLCVACGRRLTPQICGSWPGVSPDRNKATCAPSLANPTGPHVLLPGYSLQPLARTMGPTGHNPQSDDDFPSYVPQELWDDVDNPVRRVIANLLAKVEAVEARVDSAKRRALRAGTWNKERFGPLSYDLDSFEVSRDFSEIDEAL